MGAMLSKNVIMKNDQLVMYASRLLNKIKHNYNATHIEALIIVLILHKFKHYY
jgi:hypothetical protein